MLVTTAFLFITGMSIVTWTILFWLGTTCKMDTDFYTAMTKVVGGTYTIGNMLLLMLARFS